MSIKQPKVSTRTYNALQKRKKIKEYLKTEELGASPMNVACYTKINYNTTKSTMIKMTKDGELKRLNHPKGFYCLVENKGHSIFSWNFHNLIITYDFESNMELEYALDANPINEIVNYRLEICKTTKKATFRLKTDYPQNFLSIIPIIWLFQKIIKLKTRINPPLNEIKIKTSEFNKDDKKVRIDGANAITYTDLMNQIKLYNKEHALRREIKTTAPFTAETLFALLHGGSIALQNARSNTELTEQIKEQGKQLRVVNKTIRELFMFLSNERKKNN